MFDFLRDPATTALPQVRRRMALSPIDFRLLAGDQAWRVSISSAGIVVDDAPLDAPSAFTLEASAAAWSKLRSETPPPGYQTLTTMRRRQHLRVSGDTTAFLRHLLLLEMLFSRLSDDVATATQTALPPAIEPVTGRYLNLAIDGRMHRLYFEEAGQGIPLLCLHTAGSDGRQFRHLMNDPAVTDRFRVIAFDLPWHGKSSPPAGFETEVYTLTTDSYLDVTLAVADALQLDKPVVMGCSIGGRAVLHLALRHGARFRAAIGLQSALYAEDISLGDPLPESALHRPDLHGGEVAGASMAGMIAPQSPAAERWETMWHYMQGGPGVFMGDLNYYFAEGDLRNGLADGLRDSPCPLYLLSGEYDPSATPEMGREVADLAGAVHFEVMRGMGHFPMSENPVLFRQYLLPVLDKILEA